MRKTPRKSSGEQMGEEEQEENRPDGGASSGLDVIQLKRKKERAGEKE